MSFENTITAQLIMPKSESDTNYEDFEFLLAWYGRDGAFYWLMFLDWINSEKYKSETINRDDSDNIQSIPEQTEREVVLITENLSLTDLQAYLSINTARKIVRVYKDGTIEGVGINPKKTQYPQKGLKYDLKITIILENLRVVQ